MADLTYPTFQEAEQYLKGLFLVLTGQEKAPRNEVIHAAYVAQGYLQGLVFPLNGKEPAVGSLNFGAVSDLSDKEAVLALGTLVRKRKAKQELQALGLLGNLLSGVDLKKHIAELLLPIIMRWIEDWLKSNTSLDDLIQQLTD